MWNVPAAFWLVLAERWRMFDCLSLVRHGIVIDLSVLRLVASLLIDGWIVLFDCLRRIVTRSGLAYWQVYQDIRASRESQRTNERASTLERLLISQCTASKCEI